MNSIVKLLKNTGICGGHYKYFASQGDCDSWFSGKAFQTIDKVNVVRGESPSKNGYNVGTVHVPLPHSELTECDYIMFKNVDEEDRWFKAVVTSREYVNQKSTRIYFAIDYVGSYWGDIELKNCFIQRSHIEEGDDWEGDFTASKYLLPEPFSVDSRSRGELLPYTENNPFNEINEKYFPQSDGELVYNMITSMSQDGDIHEPEILFQAGSSISGYVTIGKKPEIEKLMGKYITYGCSIVNKATIVQEGVKAIYLTPVVIGNNMSGRCIEEFVSKDWTSFLDLSRVYKPRNAKVYDYFLVQIIAGTGSVTFTPAESGSKIQALANISGGPNGCVTLNFGDNTGRYNGMRLQSPVWPAVSTSSTCEASSTTFSLPIFTNKPRSHDKEDWL